MRLEQWTPSIVSCWSLCSGRHEWQGHDDSPVTTVCLYISVSLLDNNKELLCFLSEKLTVTLCAVLFVVVVFCCCFTAQQVSSRERSCSLELVDIIYTEQRQSAVTSCNLTEAQVCCTRRCTLLYCTLTTVHSLHHTSPAHLINKWKIYIFTYFSLSLSIFLHLLSFVT